MRARGGAAARASPIRPQTGCAIDTWATTPGPKKLFSRAKVRSTNWSMTTKSPGARSSRRLPTADNDTMSVTPTRFSASMLARKLIAEGGSLREDLAPGDFVIVDQFIDRTFAREKSFFGPGVVAHVSMAHPVCGRIGDAVAAAAPRAGIGVKRGGTYLVMEGPQFSTLAESQLYRSWGCDVVGMTNMPEAKLAREAEICYATVAMVTDYDCWHPGHEAVSVEMILSMLNANAAHAQALIRAVVPLLAGHEGPCHQGCQHALEHALITAPDHRDPALLARLGPLAARVLRG